MKSDLNTLSKLSDIFKYTNDTTLLVSKDADIGLNIESKHIIAWANAKSSKDKFSRTKETVFRRPIV